VLYVSRQSYFYDNGALGVEIATQRDTISPGALGPKYGEAITSYDDPREAAAAAIEVAERWRRDVGDRLPQACFTIAASVLVYPTIEDGRDADELRAWAEHRWQAMAKCERCSEVANAREWRPLDGGDAVVACSESCAEALLSDG
jgi:hypothetical protein